MLTDCAVLQQQLGYQFKNLDLLIQALTHRSRTQDNNERLEYLGDSILSFVIAEKLYQQFPTISEGDLTRLRACLVRGSTLASLARTLDLGHYMLLGSGEQRNKGYERESILAGTFEALLGAIYLDSGLDSVQEILNSIYAQLLDEITPGKTKDPKTSLQETLQKTGRMLPIYKVTSQSGKPHNLHFIVSCMLADTGQKFVGEGHSKRSAEQDAASRAIVKIDQE